MLALGGAAAARGQAVDTTSFQWRGSGQPTSMFGTYIRKGELLIYPFFEYYRDHNFEYKPAELGYGLDRDFRGGAGELLHGGQSGLRMGRISRELLVVQVALATTLLVVSGLMVKGAVSQVGKTPVHLPEETVTARIELDPVRYPTELEEERAVSEILDRLREQPGVTAVAAGTTTPGFSGPRVPGRLPDQPHDRPDLATTPVSAVSAGYFAAYGFAVPEGREFSSADRPGLARVAVVTQSFTAKYLGGRGLGARFSIAGPAHPFSPARGVPHLVEVVGVVEDVVSIDGGETDRGAVFLPLGQVGDARIAVGIRAAGTPAEAMAALRRIVLAIDQDLPVFQEAALTDLYAEATAGERVFTSLFAGFGLSGLGLASVGSSRW
jgi:hypothetical protein